MLLGVDGTLDGTRRRARLFGGNGDVPLMIVSVGEAEPLRAALESWVRRSRRGSPCACASATGSVWRSRASDPSGLQKLTIYG